MKTMIQAAAVTLCAASAAQAQQAVQWRVEDGGNGHWYQLRDVGSLSWNAHRDACTEIGGHLATISSGAENAKVKSLIPLDAPFLFGPSIGFAQGPGASEPSGGWAWVTGEPVTYTHWHPGEPNNRGPGENWVRMRFTDSFVAWNDTPETVAPGDLLAATALVEWDADCNNDGIVDYGQCHDGTLPDYDSNNIPDCCESGTACVVSNYPVQWRVEDGGNGHWYQVRQLTTDCWDQSRLLAQGSGGYLATIASAGENQLIHLIVQTFYGSDVSIGGYYDFESNSWRWVSGETWQYSNWQAGEPGCCLPNEWWLDFNMVSGEWRDRIQCIDPPQPFPAVALFEWSADCNNDGIVDYGQILQGQLADANADGVPDICQQPTCVDADFFRDFTVNGADLGILLSQWGSNTPLTVSDLNGDGGVDGADLGLFLSFWGACP